MLFISFSAYAVMWTLKFHFYNSIFYGLNMKYWNPDISFVNKWKQLGNGLIVIKNGKKVEKFPCSSTFFVWLTDAFHLSQSIFLNSLFMAFSFMADGKEALGFTFQWWSAFIGIRLIYAFVFEGLFGWLLIKK